MFRRGECATQHGRVLRSRLSRMLDRTDSLLHASVGHLGEDNNCASFSVRVILAVGPCFLYVDCKGEPRQTPPRLTRYPEPAQRGVDCAPRPWCLALEGTPDPRSQSNACVRLYNTQRDGRAWCNKQEEYDPLSHKLPTLHLTV